MNGQPTKIKRKFFFTNLVWILRQFLGRNIAEVYCLYFSTLSATLDNVVTKP